MDAHGIKGDLYVLVFSGDVSWLPKMKKLSLDGESFDVVRAKPFKKGFIATLKGFDNRNRAEEVKGAEVHVPAEFFVSKHGEQVFLSELLGFEVEDKNLGKLGSIKGFSSNGSQDLLVIENNKKEVEIPFVKDFVVKMDFKTKTILTDLPEGLLEINEPDEN